MRFAVMTKHFHMVIKYREPDYEDGGEHVSNLGGDFDPAPSGEVEEGDPTDMHFGFVRG